MPAEPNARRELTLPSFHTSELTLELHAVPSKFYATVEDAEDEYDFLRRSNNTGNQGTAGSPGTARNPDGSRYNPFFLESDEEDDGMESSADQNFAKRLSRVKQSEDFWRKL